MDFTIKIVTVVLFVALSSIESSATVSVNLFTNPTNTGTLGQGGIELQCVYGTTSNEAVNTINIQAKLNGELDFKNIASFYPVSFNFNATLSDDGDNYLKDRVTLTNPTDETKTAILSYNTIDCADETDYRCQVLWIPNPNNDVAISSSVNINVKGNPQEPDASPVYTPTAGIEEGQTITFTCTGNLGKPQGRFRWIRFRGSQDTIYDSETTTAVTMPGTCTYNGTSSFSLTMTPEDNGVVVRCMVVYENAVRDTLYQTTPNIEVYYSVRNAVVSKPSGAPPSYAEGTDPISLSCSAEGNPAPQSSDYTWYKESNMSSPIGTSMQYTISDVVINETDTYVCVVQNTFNGKTFNTSARTYIQIEKSTTPAPTTTPSTSTEPQGTTRSAQLTNDDEGLGTGAIAGIAIGCAIVIIVIIVIIIVMMRRGGSKEDSIDEPPEKPRNNLSFVDKPDALGDKNGPFNNQIHYADLTFEDRPRSRKPLQLNEDSNLDHSPYAQVTMPRV